MRLSNVQNMTPASQSPHPDHGNGSTGQPMQQGSFGTKLIFQDLGQFL
jgi:hypothetical protein